MIVHHVKEVEDVNIVMGLEKTNTQKMEDVGFAKEQANVPDAMVVVVGKDN